MSEIMLNIDGKEVKATAGMTLLEAARECGHQDSRPSVTTRNWNPTGGAASAS